jgi:hypothetical protein
VADRTLLYECGKHLPPEVLAWVETAKQRLKVYEESTDKEQLPS